MTGGVANGTVNGAGSRLSAIRFASASAVRAARSPGRRSAALLNSPSFSTSRRLRSIVGGLPLQVIVPAEHRVRVTALTGTSSRPCREISRDLFARQEDPQRDVGER